MRGVKARSIRRQVFGDFATRGSTAYHRIEGGQILAMGLRAHYLDAKAKAAGRQRLVRKKYERR